MAFLDEVSPSYVGEDRIRLTLTEREQALRAFVPILISVDYSSALPEGIVLPLEIRVTGPRDSVVLRTLHRRFAPSQFAFTPREGGSHLVTVSECFHNLWWGRLVLEITGDRVRAGV